MSDEQRMRVVELFSGTGTLSRVARGRGHKTFTVDLFEEADLQADILSLTADDIRAAIGNEPIDMLWASPICTGFSVAAIGRNWTKHADGTFTPKTDSARLSQALLEKTIALIEELQPKSWFVENPRGMARKMAVVQELERTTITFCQYGETRMKPTDIWFDADWTSRPACKNGDPCHERAPRGASTGTQGIKDPLMRAKLPEELCVEVIEAAERRIK